MCKTAFCHHWTHAHIGFCRVYIQFIEYLKCFNSIGQCQFGINAKPKKFNGVATLNEMTYIKYMPAALPWYSISIATPIRTEMVEKDKEKCSHFFQKLVQLFRGKSQ